MTWPVRALYREPSQGQSSSPPLGATVQPMCVQIALNATACPAVGWATMIGLPSRVADTACPTGTDASETRLTPPLAAPGGVDGGGGIRRRHPSRRMLVRQHGHAARCRS